MRFLNRIAHVFNSSEEIFIDDKSKIVIISDLHRGDGNWNDSFAKNQNTFFTALSYYYKENYTYIELGDGDELWEIAKMEDIIQEHKDVFWLMSQFYKDNRFYMLYGNHDIVKRDPKYLTNNLYRYYNERASKYEPLFKGIKVHEGLILNYKPSGHNIFLIHGHQVDLKNSDLWKLTRFMVRYFWGPLKFLGINDPTRTAKNYRKRHSVGKKLTEWVVYKKQMLIASHNHRPMFPKVGEPPYFNDGSGVHPRCITGIEIRDGNIMLVKWSVKTNTKGVLFIARDILAGPEKLENYFK
ncbi:serine/threonine protein phosphatase [Tissierella creatinini]|nr:serine/threonine protein phosphatase [Tissierella creatinini]TJX63247.1 serine/threonine protein phosphatase [Soehngenia saccharolytica]